MKSNVCFPFPLAANKWKFAFSVCRKQTEFYIFCQFRFLFTEFRKRGDMNMEIDMEHGDNIDIDLETSNGKREVQAIFLNPFTVCSSCRLEVRRRWSVCSREKNGSHQFANRLNGLAYLYDYCKACYHKARLNNCRDTRCCTMLIWVCLSMCERNRLWRPPPPPPPYLLLGHSLLSTL